MSQCRRMDTVEEICSPRRSTETDEYCFGSESVPGAAFIKEDKSWETKEEEGNNEDGTSHMGSEDTSSNSSKDSSTSDDGPPIGFHPERRVSWAEELVSIHEYIEQKGEKPRRRSLLGFMFGRRRNPVRRGMSF